MHPQQITISTLNSDTEFANIQIRKTIKMASITDIHTGSNVVARFVETLRAQAERYAQYRTYRKTLNELTSLSARDLADLGLHRSMLRQVAHEATYGVTN